MHGLVNDLEKDLQKKCSRELTKCSFLQIFQNLEFSLPICRIPTVLTETLIVLPNTADTKH